MSKGRDRMVSRRPDVQWANTRNDATKATILHPTQKEAEQAARKNIRYQGGGEISIQGLNSRIRQKVSAPMAMMAFRPGDNR